MSKIFHHFLTGGCKTDALAYCGKFLSMLKNRLSSVNAETFRQSPTGGFWQIKNFKYLPYSGTYNDNQCINNAGWNFMVRGESLKLSNYSSGYREPFHESAAFFYVLPKPHYVNGILLLFALFVQFRVKRKKIVW